MSTKPEFPPDQDMRDVSPADVAEAKRRAKESKAYDKALTTTEPAPKPPVKKAKGGYVKAADGCAQRGKTRGKMV
jgi:hypothetical protein